jgi:hypothetical protein
MLQGALTLLRTLDLFLVALGLAARPFLPLLVPLVFFSFLGLPSRDGHGVETVVD